MFKRYTVLFLYEKKKFLICYFLVTSKLFIPRLYFLNVKKNRVRHNKKTVHHNKEHLRFMDKKSLANTKKILFYAELLDKVRKEASKIIVGQKNVIDGLLMGVLCNGHVLVEGVPGIAKTLIVRTLSVVTGGEFSRIQFTADLLPTDVTGLTIYEEKIKKFKIVKGPVFANFLLADEINSSPPKTQSALLEAMQEKEVTIGVTTYKLPNPFFVMATQNPIEQGGVYTLPEAQIDRFLFKILVNYPSTEDELEILEKNMTLRLFESYKLNSVITPSKINEMQSEVKKVYMSKDIASYIVNIIDATRYPSKYNINSGKYIGYGSSPRASIGLFIASKARAFMKRCSYVLPEHVKEVVPDVLRHRILLNYEGQAENINPDEIIKEILQKVKVP